MDMSTHGGHRELSPAGVQRDTNAHTTCHTLNVHDPSGGEFQISFVECMNSYSCPSCSDDIYIKQSMLAPGPHDFIRTFSNTVGSNLFPR